MILHKILGCTLFVLLSACGNAASSAGHGEASKSQEAPSNDAKSQLSANADSLMLYVKEQVDCGPRTPGGKGHAACHDLIVNRLTSWGASVEQLDTVVTDVSGRRMPVRNILATIRPEAPVQVLLLAHYDTRPWADAENDKSLHNKPIDGANDGGSGVAVLLETARLANQIPANVGLKLLFVDSEDSGTDEGGELSWAIGAQVWGKQYAQRPDWKVNYGILLDMVGGKDAVFPREYFSERYAGIINTWVRDAARSLGLSARFPEEVGGGINDDHIHMLAAGIPCIDIIECNHPMTGSFNPTWHTLDDNIDNIDPATLKAVTDVVLRTIAN